GGAFTVDLEGAEGLLSVEWLDPTVGRTAFGARVVGGKTVEFVTPFDGDAVLLLQRVTQDADEKDPARLGIVPPEPIADDFVLRVSEDGHRLVNGDGQPFFWLGDTGWAMLTALTLDETETYLENRRQKGFNVVQCIAAHWNPGAVEPNQASDGPWTDDDPSKPNAAFFDHVDRVCEMAQAKGIVIGLLPCWGDFVVNKHVTAGSARAYGRWLGERYRDTPNLVWILGGDQPPTGVEDAWTAMAEGIAEGDGDRHLMTYHPRGWQTSSTFWHDADWLDFNMLQSGHNWDRANHEMILADYGLAPPKPTLDGEPRYEHITDGLSKDPETRRFDAHQVRKAAYNAVLSGALGHTYGCREIYSFWRPDQEAGWGADTPWQQAMDFPGAGHMGYVRALMLSHPWQTLRPMPTLIAAGQGSGGSDAPAALTADGTLALVYVPDGRAVGVNLGKVTGGGVDVSWYNPQTGTSTAVGEHPNKGVVSFAPPAANPDPDFVLVLESSGPDETPPTVERADAARRAGRIIAAFSEPVTGESAE
ncbi:MAG TPA: glycoside hydrolase family 140 protein, partial [Armatimonadota bacterium]|nr:glycoside hydrolase family 140 protein [Armatimonadota bacterium]